MFEMPLIYNLKWHRRAIKFDFVPARSVVVLVVILFFSKSRNTLNKSITVSLLIKCATWLILLMRLVINLVSNDCTVSYSY